MLSSAPARNEEPCYNYFLNINKKRHYSGVLICHIPRILTRNPRGIKRQSVFGRVYTAPQLPLLSGSAHATEARRYTLWVLSVKKIE